MRKILLLLFCSVISLTASAQWWKLKKREPHPDPIEMPKAPKLRNYMEALTVSRPRMTSHTLSPSDRVLESAQATVMKLAQHNMRFRIYSAASYNFSDLAQLYVKQNRFSEAKWYFLQSIYLSRQQNNFKLMFKTLINLASVKLAIGDFSLAQQDLIEARDLATSKGWLIDLIEVEKKLGYMQHSRVAALRVGRYADELASEN